jgi:hypothetical protein
MVDMVETGDRINHLAKNRSAFCTGYTPVFTNPASSRTTSFVGGISGKKPSPPYGP